MAPTDSRSSTMRHLRKLMAATAVAGLAAATSRGTASARSAPATPEAGTDAGADGATPHAALDAGADVEADAEVPVPQIPYGVVDPLPPPARGGCGCHESPGMAQE